MKRFLILACILALSTGCASVAKKRFTLIVDPPDADITVRPGGGQPEQKYRSPADITVSLPKDRREAGQARLEIRRESYQPMNIVLSSIRTDTLRLKLSKIRTQYRLKLLMTHPKQSDDLSYRDRVMSIRLTPGERNFTASIRNLADQPIQILWDKSEYDDCTNRPHRIIPTDVKPENRQRPIPPQVIPAGGSLVQTFMPDDMAVYSKEKKAYESQPLFPLDSDNALGLKGRNFIITLPVQIDRAIIPDYVFQFDIVDVVKE